MRRDYVFLTALGLGTEEMNFRVQLVRFLNVTRFVLRGAAREVRPPLFYTRDW